MFSFLNTIFSGGNQKPLASILIIDNNQVDRTRFQKILEKRRYRIWTAGSGEEGLKIVEIESIDLIILEYYLPRIEGLEVCRILKQNNKTKKIQVLFVTSADKEKILYIFEAEAEYYLHKPVDADELVRQVKLMLEDAKTM